MGLSYTFGEYKVNVCDPYTVRGKLQHLFFSSREGVCLKKTNLYSKHLSNFRTGADVLLKVYSYVRETFEFNLFEVDSFINVLTLTGDTVDEVFEVSYQSNYINLLSLYARL